MKRLGSVLLIFLLITTGCDMKTVGEQPIKMPEEMPDDFDFTVRYGYGEVTKNEINTYQDTVTKDLIMNGTAVASITFTTEEMRSIYEKMIEINIMGKKQLVPTNVNCFRTPHSEDRWKISLDGETKTFTWSEQYCDVTSDAMELLELRSFIQQIVAGKAAYKALPEAEGGYD